MTAEVVAIVPAAGRAVRLANYHAPKELFPVGFSGPPGAPLKVKLAIDFTFELLAAARVPRAMVVVSDVKHELIRQLGEGTCGVDVGYVVQRPVDGLARAVHRASRWINGEIACLALPDTIVRPATALARVLAAREERGDDLVLGVFPTSTPQLLGPVDVEAATGRVLRVHEKPAKPLSDNTWGVACWAPSFNELLGQAIVESPSVADLSLGEVFQRAVEHELNVSAVCFAGDDVLYHDIGTPHSLAQVWGLPRLG